MSKPPVFLLVVLMIILLLAGRQFIKQRREAADNDASPVRTLRAEVKHKREYSDPARRSRQREVIAGETMRYEAWFHPLDGGADIKAPLAEGDYHRLDTGAQGELRIQGSRFISFTPRQ